MSHGAAKLSQLPHNSTNDAVECCLALSELNPIISGWDTTYSIKVMRVVDSITNSVLSYWLLGVNCVRNDLDGMCRCLMWARLSQGCALKVQVIELASQIWIQCFKLNLESTEIENDWRLFSSHHLSWDMRLVIFWFAGSINIRCRCSSRLNAVGYARVEWNEWY